MKLFQRDFAANDFMQIRNKLIEFYNNSHQYNNWLIDRWNFSRYVSQTFNDTYEDWPKTVGIWVDKNNSIMVVVNSEGERSGEVFIQQFSSEISEENYIDFINYAEKELYIKKNDTKEINIRINQSTNFLKKELIHRGYKLLDWKEALSSLKISKKYTIDLDRKYKIIDGIVITNTQKSIAHSMAFGYTDNKSLCERYSPFAFKKMTSAPDYNPQLDLAIIDKIDNYIISFVTIWFDPINKIGILEPVGTVPGSRKLGLAKLLIHEGCNRLLDLGCNKVYVGSDQDFYKKIGFKVEYYKDVYSKIW
jgi:hypothetical protein